jgi:hypothetical protein
MAFNHHYGIKNNIDKTLQSVQKLVSITNVPTRMNIVFKGSFPTSFAAIGQQ